MIDPEEDMKATAISAYRRIQKAYSERRGVRLSADEVDAIWMYDDAIQAAVNCADEEEEDAR